MGHARQRPQISQFRLTLLSNGGAELLDNGQQAWASDTDDEFADEFGNEFLDENDLDDVLNYLVEGGYMTDSEADECDCIVDSFERSPDAPDEDEEDEEDEEEDEEDNQEYEV